VHCNDTDWGVWVTLNRYSAKRDENEPLIIAAFKNLGCKVQTLSATGVPDLAVLINGTVLFVEVKMPKKYLNDKQGEFFAKWRGHCAVVRTVEDVIELVKKTSAVSQPHADPR
jgi:hypothetical protein